jgi:ribosome-associated toxin RatA of RatAB toxin-antitoxin module
VTHIHKTALVNYSTQEMYHLVNEIETYPDFLPWCKSIKVISRHPHAIVASITMGGAGMEKSFTTRNRLIPNQRIEMSLIDGPFSHLEGLWLFQPLGETGCKISLEMNFEISNKLLRVSLAPVFTKIMNNLVDAFVERARKLYG